MQSTMNLTQLVTTVWTGRGERVTYDDMMLGTAQKAAGKWNAIADDWHIVCATRDEAIEALFAIALGA